MHGLICKAVEGFIRNQHGAEAWSAARARAELPFDSFEALRDYDAARVEGMLDAIAAVIGHGRDAMFEDIGHWICTHPPLERVRRLIRFTGATFTDLLYGLDEVHDRACMAVPGLNLPNYRLVRVGSGEYEAISRWSVAGGAALLTGALRAMADDYGTLALIEATGARREDEVWRETIAIRIVDAEFHQPREFTLGGVT